MKQYEIWWAELPKPAGRRPVLLLSRDDAYAFLNKFIAAEITKTIRRIPIEVMLGPMEGLPKRCVANFDTLSDPFRNSILWRELDSFRPPRSEKLKELWDTRWAGKN